MMHRRMALIAEGQVLEPDRAGAHGPASAQRTPSQTTAAPAAAIASRTAALVRNSEKAALGE